MVQSRVIEEFSGFYYFSLFSYTINACILKNKRGNVVDSIWSGLILHNVLSKDYENNEK